LSDISFQTGGLLTFYPPFTLIRHRYGNDPHDAIIIGFAIGFAIVVMVVAVYAPLSLF
jgi:hypothetical protein